jgi:undecaprenyl-diphosphatase
VSRWTHFTLVVITGIAATAAVLAVLWNLHAGAWHDFFRRADPELTAAVRALQSAPADLFMLALAKFGSWKGMVPATVLIVLLLARARHRAEAIGFGVAMLVADGLHTTLKLLFRRPRPNVEWALATETSFSFPSGHALVAVVFYGMLVFMAWRLLRPGAARIAFMALAVTLGVMTGVCRVYLGVHYPSDVLAGFIAGGVWLAAAITATQVLQPATKV